MHNAGQGFGCDGEGMQSEHGRNAMEDKVQRAAQKGRESEGKSQFFSPTDPSCPGLPARYFSSVGPVYR